jgi:hypothetical protein
VSENVEMGQEISRTNQLFIELRRVGEVDAKGKVKFACGYRGKIVASPDRPLALFAKLIHEFVCRGFRYSTPEAAKMDLEQFQKWAAGLTTQPRAGAPSGGERP